MLIDTSTQSMIEGLPHWWFMFRLSISTVASFTSRGAHDLNLGQG